MSDFLKTLPPEALFGQCVQVTKDLTRKGPIELARQEGFIKMALNGFRDGADAADQTAAQELLDELPNMEAVLILINSPRVNDILHLYSHARAIAAIYPDLPPPPTLYQYSIYRQGRGPLQWRKDKALPQPVYDLIEAAIPN